MIRTLGPSALARLRPQWLAWLALATGLALLTCLACASRGLTPHETGLLFLWQVESHHDGGGEAHLLGSVHLGASAYQFDPAVEAAFDDADALVVEVDLRAVGGERAGALLQSMGLLAEGVRLDTLLPAQTWQRFEALLRRNGQETESYQRLEPWVAFTVATALLLEESELRTENGVDRYFLSRAGEQLEVIALETLEFQFSIFDSLPLDLQVTLLDDLLAEGGDVAREAESLVAAWRLGDTEVLERMISAPFAGEPRLDELRNRLFDQRNHRMSRRLDELLQEDRRLFVVLGAGHMVGFQGIPSLLQGRGHHVWQLPKSP